LDILPSFFLRSCISLLYNHFASKAASIHSIIGLKSILPATAHVARLHHTSEAIHDQTVHHTKPGIPSIAIEASAQPNHTILNAGLCSKCSANLRVRAFCTPYFSVSLAP